MSSETYLAVLFLHRFTVACSLGLFVARGLGVQCGMAWPMARGWRHASVAIDVLLLAAGVSLWVLMLHNPWREPWLAVKLALLPVYVALGSLALKRARTPRARRGFFVASLLVATTMLVLATVKPGVGLSFLDQGQAKSPQAWLGCPHFGENPSLFFRLCPDVRCQHFTS